MIRFTRSYRIAAAPAEVFAVLTDPARLPEWQKGTVEVEQITPGTKLTFTAEGRAPRLLGPLLKRQFDAHHGRPKELVER